METSTTAYRNSGEYPASENENMTRHSFLVVACFIVRATQHVFSTFLPLLLPGQSLVTDQGCGGGWFFALFGLKQGGYERDRSIVRRLAIRVALYSQWMHTRKNRGIDCFIVSLAAQRRNDRNECKYARKSSAAFAPRPTTGSASSSRAAGNTRLDHTSFGLVEMGREWAAAFGRRPNDLLLRHFSSLIVARGSLLFPAPQQHEAVSRRQAGYRWQAITHPDSAGHCTVSPCDRDRIMVTVARYAKLSLV